MKLEHLYRCTHGTGGAIKLEMLTGGGWYTIHEGTDGNEYSKLVDRMDFKFLDEEYLKGTRIVIHYYYGKHQ